eukprot:776033-Prorocentrum_minimum.AAC.3
MVSRVMPVTNDSDVRNSRHSSRWLHPVEAARGRVRTRVRPGFERKRPSASRIGRDIPSFPTVAGCPPSSQLPTGRVAPGSRSDRCQPTAWPLDHIDRCHAADETFAKLGKGISLTRVPM